jgi:hypothetical protein
MLQTTMEQPAVRHSIDQDVDNLAGRLLRLCLLINIVIPAFLFLAVYLLRSTGALPAGSMVAPNVLQLLFYAFLVIAVSEVGVAFVIKRAVFSPEKIRPTLSDNSVFARHVTGGTVTLAALGAASAMYGVLLCLLGIEVTYFAAFALIALVHFRLFRPTPDTLRAIINQAS